MAGLNSGPIGRSLTALVVGLTQRDGPFDDALTQAFVAAGAKVYDRPAPEIRDLASARGWLEAAANACGAPIDILVHNRRDRRLRAVEQLSFDTWRSTQSYLVDAAFLLSNAFSEQQRSADRAGAILTLVDALVIDDAVGASGTGAASAALAAMTRGWAVEWAADRIRANILGYAFWDEPEDPVTALSVVLGVDLAATTPIGRIAAAQDVIAMGLYLCSPYAAYVTGSTMIVDGGEGLRHTLGGPIFRPPREDLSL